jgi:hypothetical protein
MAFIASHQDDPPEKLLLALKLEGMRRGIPVEFRGHSPAMRRALTLLGVAPDFSGCTAS